MVCVLDDSFDMPASQPENSPPPLPKPVKSNAERKVVSISSFAVSVLVFWFVLLLIPSFYVVGPGEKEGIPRTFWDVLIEEHSIIFLFVNMVYFLLIPIGVIGIATDRICLPWWSYPLVPGVAIAVLGLAIAFF